MADQNALSKRESATTDLGGGWPSEHDLPPPGPGYHVTDGYPHRETDPRNWPRHEERPRRPSPLVSRDDLPPPGPTNWVTDGYPHRKTDPRNWPTNGARTRESGSSSPHGTQNGAAPDTGQRAPHSRLKEFLDRWLR